MNDSLPNGVRAATRACPLSRTLRAALCAAALLAGAAALTGCGPGGPGVGGGSEADAAEPATPEQAPVGVPVEVAPVRHENVDVAVTASGRTQALRQGRVRAPYASRVIELRVADGDVVKKGQIVAVVVSKNSQAALDGARQMLAAAHTAADKADAERAIALAKMDLVRQSLRAPAAGVVLSHSAEAGDYVDESEVLVTLAETDSVFFQAEVPQSAVDGVKPGQPASVSLPAVSAKPVPAVVHGILPLASTANFSAPVRLDFASTRPALGLGLFGTARIVVARHADATVVPQAAVLTDDVTGISRVAVVDGDGKAHWLDVSTGVTEGDSIEITKPAIATNERVIVDGQVGLPEGTKVQIKGGI